MSPVRLIDNIIPFSHCNKKKNCLVAVLVSCHISFVVDIYNNITCVQYKKF